MNVGLYRGAVAMGVQQHRLDTIASNLANLGTAGFKRERTAAHQFQLPGVSDHAGPRQGLRSSTRVDFGQGNLRRTGRDLDLALFGEGFFALEGPQGEVYTRDGALQVTRDGELVSQEGFPVAWATRSGAIDPTGFPIEVDGEGTVRQGEREIGRLRLVNFEDPARLRVDRTGNWIAPEGTREAAYTAQVHQGALEESNATGVEEMVALINVQRSFEAVANVMSSIEESYRRLTRPF